jgi:formylglycine-generating enzyme required for sulfatase activity
MLLAWVLLAPGLAPAQERPAKLSLDLGGGVKMDFVLIRPGSFMMGSEKGDDEKPVHKVTITRPFYMGVYKVTQAQWKAVIGDNPSSFKGDDLPVEQVSWEDCQRFVAKLKEKAGQGMICRLPTEAEWEYACRAGTKTEYCFGDDEGGLGEYAWYRANSEGKTRPVGQKKPNAWGLYDMHGNVWEWCEDGYSAGYYAKSPEADPKGPSTTAYRVLRGASWGSSANDLRSASRLWYYPSGRYYFYRCCRVVMSAGEAR